MNKENCFYLGKITKSFGLKGEVNVFLDVDNPQEYSQMESVLVEINKQLIPFFIEKQKSVKGNQIVVKFEDIDDVDQTAVIINKDLYLPLELLPKLEGNKFYFHEIKGFKVKDKKHGELGIVSQVVDLPNNPLMEIITTDNIEILMPIQDQFIKKLNRKNKTITIEAPEGLIEMYLDV